MDISQLQTLVNDLNSTSKKFSDAAKTILDKAKSLDSASQDIATNSNTWAGKGAQSFLLAWNKFHYDAINSANTLDSTALLLSKFASNLQDSINNMESLLWQAVGLDILTVGLTVVDILQLGLDPVTDTATGVSGGADVKVISEISNEANAREELDAQLSTEIEQVTTQIEESTSLGKMDIPADQTADVTELENELNTDVYSGSNLDGEDPNELINQLNESGTKFTEEDVVGITRTPDGKIDWLEKGNPSAGLEHIMEGDGTPGDIGHAGDFANIGVNGEENVTKLIIDTVQNDTPIGTRGGGMIYNVTINGVIRKILIVVGRNGFIVTAYPIS